MNNPANIRTWRRINPHLTTSGQPTEVQLTHLFQIEISHIINLGMHDHDDALADEASSVARLGMTYIHIPVAFDNPTDEDFNQFCAAISPLTDTKVHIHCIANLRVTAFLYKYHRDVCGIAESEARKPMDSVWRPGGVWAKFIGDSTSEPLPHRPPVMDKP